MDLCFVTKLVVTIEPGRRIRSLQPKDPHSTDPTYIAPKEMDCSIIEYGPHEDCDMVYPLSQCVLFGRKKREPLEIEQSNCFFSTASFDVVHLVSE
ncbi:unnamed protein product [Allacma fusca]|uniref:Uncharacterized protein n=1 Tax=Allacma fusca TaxID=39272 RepID=A0A8J2PSD9_9HEXA|nr:unnamed protein product [Allacma fusca]